MVAFPLTGGSPNEAVRRPVFEVSFGGGGGGLASAAAGALGGGDPWQMHIVAVTVEAGLAPLVNVAEVHLAVGEEAPTTAVGDEGSVALGYQDSGAEPVFAGLIDGIRYSVLGETRLTATDGSAALSRLRVNQSYEQQTAADIVNDLTGQAGVSTDTVDEGISFPFYVIDDGRNAYQHIAHLARKSGYLAHFTPEGALYFAPFAAGQPVQSFTYGVDVLSLHVIDVAPVVGTITTVGEGAAGSEGQEAWSWLVKDPAPVQASAGDGEPERLVRDASLRSAEAVQNAADGLANAAGLMKLTGTLLAPGAPAVAVGTSIEIVEAPQEALNGVCLVRRIRHLYSKRTGFTTLIGFSKTDEGGLGGLL